jgi:hypothetical protein
MDIVSIPNWNAQGLIPPINELQPVGSARSPYNVSLTEFVRRFGHSTERRVVIDGFLKYRAALHKAGLTNGFQWLDGSFLENIEIIEGRAPNDIDVVTFYELPAEKTQRQLLEQIPALFDHDDLKSQYHVDAYLEHLGKAPARLVTQANYWYSMWSHRRNYVWKGYVQIDLAPTDDAAAATALAHHTATLGTQP